MRKLRCKLRNAKIYPLEVRILQQQKIRCHFMDKGIYSTYLSPHFQKISKLGFLFSFLGSMVSKNICKLRHKFKNAKKLTQTHLVMTK